MKQVDLKAEIVERKDVGGAWGVEAVDERGDGAILMAIFSGPEARVRATEYAHAKFKEVRAD